MTKVLKTIQPQYKDEAKAEKIEGTVLLKVIITADGNADEIKVISRDGRFNRARRMGKRSRSMPRLKSIFV
jgi:TonB family protein